MTITLISGLGRCGSTMMMHMLAAGGVDVVGAPPAYEVEEASRIPLSAAWLKSIDGRAVKVLDPHRSWRPMIPARVIWLDRDEKEQARSQIKFLRVMGVPVAGGSLGKVRAALRADRKRCMAILTGHHRMMFRFEDILADPRREAARLTTFFPAIDVEKAAAVVRARDPRCAPDLQIEVDLMRATP